MLVFLVTDAQKRMVEFPYLKASGFKGFFGNCIVGGKDGKIYQVIVKTKKSKKEIVNLTGEFLQSMNLITPEDLKKQISEVNEEMSETILPVYFATGIGIHPVGADPLIVTLDMRFEFYDEGVKLSIENFDEKFFLIHVKQKERFVPTENMEKYNKFIDDAREANRGSSKYERFWAKVDAIVEMGGVHGSIGEIKGQIRETLEKVNQKCLDALYKGRENVKEQEVLFDKMIAEDEARWYTLDYYIDYVEKSAPETGKENYLLSLRKAQEEKKLYAFDNNRWERDVRYIFDGVFISLAEMLDGSIEGVAEDGVQTWIREGDLVVPTDLKKKAKFIKKGKSFTDYDSYDR